MLDDSFVKHGSFPFCPKFYILIAILMIAVRFFYVSYENVTVHRAVFQHRRVSFFLITLLFNSVLILQGEIRCGSLFWSLVLRTLSYNEDLIQLLDICFFFPLRFHIAPLLR